MQARDEAASDDVIELACALIATDSVSPSLVHGGAGEARIVELLAQRLAARGFTTTIVPAPGNPERVSLVATFSGAVDGPTVVLNGHLDTVGVEGMPDPFTPRIEHGRLMGRGASDMKAGVAGLVIAAERLAVAGWPGTVVLALVADEEDASVGALAVLDHLARTGVAPDVCLIAEPTWLDLAVAHRGYAVVEVDLHGRTAHSSQPEEAVDAMRALTVLLAEVHAAHETLQRARPHPLLGRGTLMATVARAGTAPFSVAAHASIVIERRTAHAESAADVHAEVRALCDAVERAVPGIRATASLALARDAWEQDDQGIAQDVATALASALQAAAPVGRRGTPYWMEAALWQAAGIPTVIFGPAGGGLHAIDEWVEVDQVVRFPDAVVAALQSLTTR